MARIDHLTGGIYRISTYAPEKRLSFNQFLIDDDEPALIHTGTFPMYGDVRGAIAQVLDPSRLRHVMVPHFEADECGGMGRFIAEAPQALLACSAVGARINLQQWDYAGPFRGMQDGDVLDLGRHRLRFWETPHVHHWDSMMVVEESTKSLFPSDLFLQPGDQPPVVTEKPTVPSLASISTTRVPSTFRPKLCRLWRYSGYLAIGVAMWSSIQWSSPWS